MKEEKDYNRKTVKVAIYPTEEQIATLYYIGSLHAELFNMANAEIKYRIENRDQIKEEIENELKNLGYDMPRKELFLLKAEMSKKEKRKINQIIYKASTDYMTMCDWITPMRQSFIEFAQINRKSEEATLDRLTGAWASFLELRKNDDPKARPPGRRNSELYFDAIPWSDGKIVGAGITLAHKIPSATKLNFVLPQYALDTIAGREICRVEIVRQYPEKWIEKTKWYATITYKTTKPDMVPMERILALDLGAGSIAGIDSRGRTYLQPMRRADKYWQKILIPLKQERDALEKGEPKRNTLQEKIREMERRQSDQMKDFQRKLAHSIVQKADCFLVGKTPIRLGLAQSEDGSKKEHRGVQNTGGLSRLLTLLHNKAIEFGKTVIEVPDATFVEIVNNAPRKVVMAYEHLQKGFENSLLNSSNWPENKKLAILKIAQKSLTKEPRKFL